MRLPEAERVDPSSGRTFYIDHVNKRTSWEHPGKSAPPPNVSFGSSAVGSSPPPSGS